MAEVEQQETEATVDLYVRGSKARRGEIAWAKQLKPIRFEFSDYEKAVFQEYGSADGSSRPTS
jgi:hypothetical protein